MHQYDSEVCTLEAVQCCGAGCVSLGWPQPPGVQRRDGRDAGALPLSSCGSPRPHGVAAAAPAAAQGGGEIVQ